MERLHKYLARAGVASRRKAERLMLDGKVQVNGQVVCQPGSLVDAQRDEVCVEGRKLSLPAQHSYFIFYKPRGVLTTLADPQGRPCVGDWLSKRHGRVYPVGRLDYDTEGALLLTDDGDLVNRLLMPRFQIPRSYVAKVRGKPSSEALQQLCKGVVLSDGKPALALRAKFHRILKANSWVVLTVAEGRYHLVKRMFEAIGHPVLSLFRPAQAGISVLEMRPGQMRALTQEEGVLLKAVALGTRQPPLVVGLPARVAGVFASKE
ncbi:MAG: rRNA pseudouridine synthase [Proteobacteria bacterium]|nr:rRNA pseudouridine synthase [Cystobacterineae bacterium]MCL2259360.1 rRNA pseudouridine synthase [Cystobacterineae bacterium]MCL2314193.1 rRNA pseudouridine synthase [Pseudomonadota bacterium]